MSAIHASLAPTVATLATAGAQGFDADTVLTAEIARTLVSLRYTFAVRYVSRLTPQNVGDLLQVETSAILGAGLALMLVQHCPPAYWTPSAALGTRYGGTAAFNAVSASYPTGATVWLDLENMRPGCGVPTINAYVNAWCRAIEVNGYLPGVYFSADCPLTPDEIYLDWITRLYWRSLSADTPAVAVRGACMQQFAQQGQVAGIDLDRDVILPDNRGGLPTWAIGG